MKSFRQTIQETSTNDKLDKLGHNKSLSGSRLKQLTRTYSAFEDIDLEQWQGYPPPRNSSQVTKNEIHNLISLGQFRDQWETDMSMHDTNAIQAFRDYLNKHKLEVDLNRINGLRKQTDPILLSLKRYYNRPRPKVLATKLGIDLSFFPLKTAETPSYPSGHAAQGKLMAKLIADEVPFEHKRNILDIGERIGYSRQIAGAHYQSDTDFGHRLGNELYRLATTSKEPDLTLESMLDNIVEYDTIKEEKELLLMGATSASTQMEGVIVACHNNSNLGPAVFDKKIMTIPIVKQFLKTGTKFATSGKSTKEQAEILYNFSQVLKKRIGSGRSDAGVGQGYLTVSGFWNETTGKGSDVSKTDILVSGKKTSVKGPVAQLMSGKKRETKATVLAAAEASGGGKDLRQKLLAACDKFVETTTVGQKMTTGALRKLSFADAKKTGNEEAKKIVETQEQLKAEVNKAFNDAFKDSRVAYEFAKEAMTGWEKFGGKSIKQNNKAGDTTGEATHMLVWSYDMDRVLFKKIDKNLINHSSKNMRPDASFKSGGKRRVGAVTPTNLKGTVGYSIFQTLRIETKQLIDKQGEFIDQANEQVKIAGNQLNEGLITEIDFKAIASKVWNWFKDKIKSLWNWFVEKIKALRAQIVELLNKSPIQDILADFEGDVSVRVNPVVRFKI